MPDEIVQPGLKDQLHLLKEAYIKLLNDKDVLLNWGKPQLEALYSTKIGVWMVQRLQAQLRIKALQLKIEKLTSALNRQQPIDITAIELEVAAMLAEAESRIMLDAAKIEKAKHLLSHLDSPERTGELRKLYRELAKQLHPDVNNNLTQEQIQLWHQVKEAYENGDLEKLKAFRVVYEKELSQAAAAEDELTEEQLTLRLAVLKEGIKVLQEEVNHIRSLFPFTIESNIKDDEWVEQETTKLKDELEKLRLYEEELTLQYQQMISLL
ncbi:MAG: J domain-containing protein [Ferruginibacter sp.]